MVRVGETAGGGKRRRGGLAPIEAGGCAMPSIAMAGGGIRETVLNGVTGLLVPGDADSFGVAIARSRTGPKTPRSTASGRHWRAWRR